MKRITITQSGDDGLYVPYLYGRVKDKFSYLPAKMNFERDGDRTVFALETESRYCPYVQKFTEENIADVISVGYKYRYFAERLHLPLLTEYEKRLLLTALSAADLKEDRVLVVRQLKGFEQYCLDGLFRFRLRDLKNRWDEIIQYVPSDFGKQSLEGFIGFLAEDGEGKIYLKGGKVYDEKYRVMNKSALTGQSSVIGEILLCGAERVYCFGETDEETKEFLEKFYKEKAVFC